MFKLLIHSRRNFTIIPKWSWIQSIHFLSASSTTILFTRTLSRCSASTLSPLHLFSVKELSHSVQTTTVHQVQESQCSSIISDLELLASKIHVGNSEHEVFQSLLRDQTCHSIQISNHLIDILLHRFQNDWKSALGLFQWATSRSGFTHTSEAYDKMVDILGKMKQLDKMWLFVEEMSKNHAITIKTVAKIMRRLAGAGRWRDAIKTFDDLGNWGLEKNTESMNLLLDTLCKERKVELAREVFLVLKSHISPNAHTFNIFIHGWCKAKRIDEAHWTIQEMKGHGCRPSVISYTTIIRAYCNQSNFRKVYEVLDDMQAQGCHPNVVTFTTIMYSLAKSEEFEQALKIREMKKSVEFEPDTLFYNALIYILWRAGRIEEAVHIFEAEMPRNGITPNSSTYNTMIAMFCDQSQEQNALHVLKKMEKSTFCKPDLQTYNPLLKLCFKTGKMDNTLSILLKDMVHKHNLSLDLSTFTLIIHGLCRTNKCEWAYLIFEEMIGQFITPRYQTCRLLLDEVKQRNMYAAAERIEVVMKQMKTSS